MMDWRNTKLIDRIEWASQNLKPFQTEYCVVYDDINMGCSAILYPSSHKMAALMHGGIHPPAWVKIKLKQDEQHPDFVRHSDWNGHLLHETEPMPSLTEKQAIEHLILTDIPKSIWETWDKGNKPKIVICKKTQLPQTREWRDAWRIAA